MHASLSRTVLLASLALLISACAGGRPQPPCGDGLCEAGESWEMCQADCPPPCGDGVRQDPEECDGADLGGATCLSIGLGPGALECVTSSCYLNTAGCGPCTDDCAANDPAWCDQDTLVTCRQNDYTCWKWTRADCTADGQLCDEGTGVAICSDICSDACLADATRCADTILQTCVTGANGCLAFSTTEDCAATGRLCEGGACACPPEACAVDATRCEGTVIQTCADQGAGCGAWTDGEDCAAASRLCDDGTGEAACVLDCTSTCSGEGTTDCDGDVVRTCTLQASGCLAPEDTEDCAATGRTCSGGSCACVDQCADGQLQCSGNTVQTCATDGHGCRVWQDSTDCAAQGQVCSGGVCGCDNQCADGQTQCSGNIPQTCVANGSGCWIWTDGAACNAPLEYCGAGACHGYTRTDFTGSYANITGGTSLTTGADDSRYGITLPFTFQYYGAPYTQVYACTNGWINFGGDPGTNDYTNGSSFPDSGDPPNAVYPYWDDLDIDSWDCWSNAGLRWETQGSAPNRVVIIQWRDFCAYLCTTCRGNMQVRLHETTNVIELMYNRSLWSGSYGASIGIEEDGRGLGLTVSGSISGAPSSDYRFTPY